MLHVMAELDPMVWFMMAVIAVAFGVAGVVVFDLFGSPEATDATEPRDADETVEPNPALSGRADVPQ